MQREIRKRCGFGCVICGIPLYEYEHMLEWAVVKRHVAEEITLLCDQHHREKTNGLLPAAAVKEANENPFNLRDGVSAPYTLHFSGSECATVIGGNAFTTRDRGHGTQIIPLLIDGVPMVGFILSDGHLLLNVNVFDEYNELAFRIQNNVVTYGTTAWDVTLIGHDLKIREAHGKFLLDIKFQTPNSIVISRARFLLNGIEVRVTPDELHVVNNNTRLQRCHAQDVEIGVALGTDIPNVGGVAALRQVSRYQQTAVPAPSSV